MVFSCELLNKKILLGREIADEPTGRQNQHNDKQQGGDNTGNDQMNRVEIVAIFGIALALAHPEKTPRYCLERLEEVQLAPGKFFDVISHVVSRPRTRHARRSRLPVRSR